MRQEGLDYMGEHPCLFSEIGIPYDMDDKYAYKTGDYTSQALAMDANHFALEGSGTAGFTLWVYMATVCYKVSIILCYTNPSRITMSGATNGTAKISPSILSTTNHYP